ncbi:ABC-type transport auxiliary lipoprotein family protein [Altererythrobacter sp. MF3-039]|uniref:ABC-type transport auxiliary lipoprotein family protein n=1 Tax=Altererythrobacter sp. MF3-039 TaxID=3252901 RepID=UPI00390C90C4
MMPRVKTVVATLSLASLAACVSLGNEPPDSLLTLTANTSVPAGASAAGAPGSALALAEFEAPAAIDVVRVPVTVSESELAYLKDAVWVEKPARLFRRLVAETIRTRSNRVVIDGSNPGLGVRDGLSGTIREFGYDAPTSSVVIVFDAVRRGSDAQIMTQRFESRVSGIPAEVEFVGPALNQVANDVAGQIADWMGE